MPHLFLMQVHFITDMSDKKPFVLRIDPGKFKALEKWADDEFRSTNGQIEYILDQALRKIQEEIMKKKRSLEHPVFPSGHPSKY